MHRLLIYVSNYNFNYTLFDYLVGDNSIKYILRWIRYRRILFWNSIRRSKCNFFKVFHKFKNNYADVKMY